MNDAFRPGKLQLQEKRSLAYVNGVMNMILHGIEAPNVILTNTLTNTLTENLADIQEKDRFEVVLANPPVGGKERPEVQQNFPIHTDDLIRNWLRNRNTLEFPGIWEQINYPEFHPVEFDGFRNQTGLNSLILTAKQWIERDGVHAGGIPACSRWLGGATPPARDIQHEPTPEGVVALGLFHGRPLA